MTKIFHWHKNSEFGVELKDKFKITNNLSLHTKAYKNFPLLEKTNTGLSSFHQVLI